MPLWRGTNGGAIDDRLALPGMAHDRHFVVQQASAGVEVHTGRDEVVFAATGGDADGEAVARGVGEAGQLLGENRREPDWEARLPHERHRRQRYSV